MSTAHCFARRKLHDIELFNKCWIIKSYININEKQVQLKLKMGFTACLDLQNRLIGFWCGEMIHQINQYLNAVIKSYQSLSVTTPSLSYEQSSFHTSIKNTLTQVRSLPLLITTDQMKRIINRNKLNSEGALWRLASFYSQSTELMREKRKWAVPGSVRRIFPDKAADVQELKRHETAGFTDETTAIMSANCTENVKISFHYERVFICFFVILSLWDDIMLYQRQAQSGLVERLLSLTFWRRKK